MKILQHHLFRSGPIVLVLFLSLNEGLWAQASNSLSLGVFYNYNSLSLKRTHQEEMLSYDGDEVTDELTQEELDELNEGTHKKNFHNLSINLFSGLSGDSISIFRFGAGV
ncbi:MAG: hypothetical protein JXB19_11660, partial [Bacteroidales bacterium]|nr:hypothetical protein [Bacteroidales bacterium]